MTSYQRFKIADDEEIVMVFAEPHSGFERALSRRKFTYDKEFNEKDYEMPLEAFGFNSEGHKLDESTQPFYDLEFPCDKSSIYDVNEKNLDLIPKGALFVTEWLRPHEITNSPQLFLDGSSAGDVCQGGLGDCYLMSALAIIASRPDILDYIFTEKPKYPIKRGRYVVRFFKEGAWVDIEIDDRLPCDKNRKLVFAHCSNPNEMWVPILEKSYAKLFGSYKALEAGQTKDPLVDFTGGVSYTIKDPFKNANDLKAQEELWKELTENSSEGSFLMGVSNAGDMDPEVTGLLSGHAYSILRCEKLGQERLIKLRNPWGIYEWKGAWADFSKEWTEENMKILGEEFKDDGEFWMNLKDFMTHWTQVDVVKVFNDRQCKVKWNCLICRGEWTKFSSGGVTSAMKNWKTRLFNPQYLLNLEEDSDIVISLMQKDFRYEGDEKTKNNAIGMNVYQAPHHQFTHVALHAGERMMSIDNTDLVATSKTWTYDRESALFVNKVPKGRYVIIPSTFEPGVVDTFILRVFARCKLQLVSLPPIEFYEKISVTDGEWTEETAGGCMNYWSWYLNPQYVVDVPNYMGVDGIPSNSQNQNVQSPKIVLHVVMEQEHQPVKEIGFYLFKATSISGKKADYVSLSGERVTPHEKPLIKPANQVTVSWELDKGAKYFLMPCTFHPGEVGKYQLHFYWKRSVANGKPVAVKVNKALNLPSTKYEGTWSIEENEAGGCSNYPSWMNNPKYTLEVLENSVEIELVLSLTKGQDKIAIGWYLLNGNKITHQVEQFKFAKSIHNKLIVTKGLYILILCTYNPNEVGQYRIEIFCDNPKHISFEK